MTFTEAIKTCFTKYCCFDGRARRREYWFFYLFNMVVSSVALAIGNATESSLLSSLLSIGLLLPGLGVSVRRMHDVGKSGWYLLMSLIPLAGPIIVLVKLCKDSEAFTNAYGPNPKAAADYTAYTAPSYDPSYTGTRSDTSSGTSASSGTGVAYCPNCGAQVNSTQVFCNYCGSRVR